ncbi:hypothetical protein C0995_013764 [Termitomyces sp. Mi166|nr:hypothetical protein C0995_013764 [Termitomyces sp. Mi166\
MAALSTSNPNASSSSTAKVSRLSTTLKAFKFSNATTSKPPPPPPKDATYYTFPHNRSFVSLPTSPMNPMHRNRSTTSLLSGVPSLRSFSATDPVPPVPAQPQKKRGFFRFGKKSSKSSSVESSTSTPAEDDGISLPWNFSHNIHVDEGFMGMPPSWTVRLANEGFTEEDIAEIQRRRHAGRSPYLYSPASSHQGSSIGSPSPQPPRWPFHIPTASPPPSYNLSGPTGYLLEKRPESHLRSVSTESTISHPHKPPSSLSLMTSASVSPPLPTPTLSPSTSTFTSTSTSTTSSPPLTSSPPPTSTPSSSPSTPLTRSSTTSDTDTDTDTLPKRLTALPPRLSLHKSKDSTDLSSWGEALLSGVGVGGYGYGGGTSGRGVFASAQEVGIQSKSVEEKGEEITNMDYYERAVEERRASQEAQVRVKEQQQQRQQAQGRKGANLSPLQVDVGFDEESGGHEDGAGKSARGREEGGGDEPSSSIVEPAVTARFDPGATSWDGEGDDEDVERREEEQGEREVHRTSPLWDDIEGLLRPRETLTMRGQEGRRESSRSSTSTVLAEPATISVARNVSVVRRVGRYVIGKSPVVERGEEEEEADAQARYQSSTLSVEKDLEKDSQHAQQQAQAQTQKYTHKDKAGPTPPSSSSSPLSSTFESEEESGSGSGSTSNSGSTPVTDVDVEGGLEYYWDGGGGETGVRERRKEKEWRPESEDEEAEEEERNQAQNINSEPLTRPRIVISPDDAPSPPLRSLPFPTSVPAPYTSHPTPPPIPIPVPTPTLSPSLPTPIPTPAPLSPFQRYRGWLSSVVEPLSPYIDDAVDPRSFYLDLQEIAEGDSGSVYAARLVPSPDIERLRLPEDVRRSDWDDLRNGRTTVVAIKSVAIVPSGSSSKIGDLERELGVMRTLREGGYHENVLGIQAVYVDLVEDALWIRMELMERSLADVVNLVPSGLVLGDRTVARFASDVLRALEFLQRHRIAHRDVRSDNLLVNSQGVLKLSERLTSDFSNAIQLPPESSTSSDLVGVPYWQAPEIRSPPYDALKVDVWSLGATVWEMAEAEPPFAETQQFADRWPPLSKPQLFPPAYHEFLRLCSEPPATRPSPTELTKHPFINNACGRQVIIQLISHCMTIEQALLEGDVSRGPIQE